MKAGHRTNGSAILTQRCTGWGGEGRNRQKLLQLAAEMPLAADLRDLLEHDQTAPKNLQQLSGDCQTWGGAKLVA